MKKLNRTTHYTLEEKAEILKQQGVGEPKMIAELIEDFSFKDLDNLIAALLIIAKRKPKNIEL